MDTKKLMKKLNAANEHLKKFSHVNKKALDQYVSFSDQRETILERKEEIDTAQTAIKELIDGLDLQKDEVGGMYCGIPRYQSGRKLLANIFLGVNHTSMTAKDRPDECGRNEPGSNRCTKAWYVKRGQGFSSRSPGRKKKTTKMFIHSHRDQSFLLFPARGGSGMCYYSVPKSMQHLV